MDLNRNEKAGQVSNFIETVFAASLGLKIFIFIYATYLVVYEILFSWFPSIIVGVSILSLLIYYYKLPQSQVSLEDEFFGSEMRPVIPDVLIPNSTPPNNYSMSIVAHRGAGLDAPENSLSAFRNAKARGVTAVEFDVCLTKDNVPIVFHDDDLLRVAGIDREVRDMTMAEIRKVDISVMHPLGEKFKGERIPTFADAVACCLNLGLRFFIDLKDTDEKMVEAVLKTFEQNPLMYKRAAVSSFSWRVIWMIRRKDPNIIGSMAWRPANSRFSAWNPTWENLEKRHPFFLYDYAAIWIDKFVDWGFYNFFWWYLGLSVILIQKDSITKESTYRWLKKGIRVFVWTVNSPLEKAHFHQDVKVGYLTDTLDGDVLSQSSSVSTLVRNSAVASATMLQDTNLRSK